MTKKTVRTSPSHTAEQTSSGPAPAPSPSTTKPSQTSQGIGDVTTEDRGTGARFNTNKPPLELIPLETLEQVARVLDYGRKKYASWNWAKGQSWMANLGCALRHLSAWQRGEDLDPESGESHLAHAACCILFALHFERHCRDMDDRPAQLRESYHTLAGGADTVNKVRTDEASVHSDDNTTGDVCGCGGDQAHDAGGVHVGGVELLQPVKHNDGDPLCPCEFCAIIREAQR